MLNVIAISIKIISQLVNFKPILPGQSRLLQPISSLASPEQVPPYFSSTDLDLVLCLVPPPHVFEQVENSFHGPHWQFSESIENIR